VVRRPGDGVPRRVRRSRCAAAALALRALNVAGAGLFAWLAARLALVERA